MKISLWLIPLITLIGLQACKTTRPVRPMAQYDPYPEKSSVIYLPVAVQVDSLERMLDAELTQVLAEQQSLQGGDAEIAIAKMGPLTLDIADSVISYQLPVRLGVSYDAGFSTVRAEGEIALSFQTTFQVDSSWNLSTSTVLSGHEWLKKPRLKLGLITLPAGMLGDLVIRYGRDQLALTIDHEIEKNVPLQQWVSEAWSQLREPMLIEAQYQAWLQVNPEYMAVSSFGKQGEEWGFYLKATARPFIHMGAEPERLVQAELPQLQRFEPGDRSPSSQVVLRAMLPYAQAERLAREEMLGEAFDYNNKEVMVDSISIYGKSKEVVVELKLSGDYAGEVFFTARPSYNDRKQTIELRDLDYTVSTRNFLLKTAGWLLKSSFKNRIQRELDSYLESNLGQWKDRIQEEIEAIHIAEGIQLDGQMDELGFEDLYIAQDGLVLDLRASGAMKLAIEGF